jgi:hypothetical protein
MKLSRIRKILVPISLGLLLSTNVLSQTKSFRCNFTDGLITNWDSGKPSSKRNGNFPELVFDQLDMNKGTGRLIGNAGAENVQVFNGDGSIHVIERTKSGNMNITTIFTPLQNNPNVYPVVHSRHLNISGPLVSQFVGICKNLN